MGRWNGTASFDGQSGKCADRPDGGYEFMYGGGGGSSMFDGHGHVIVNDADCVTYLREPGHSFDRTPAIDDKYGEPGHDIPPYWS